MAKDATGTMGNVGGVKVRDLHEMFPAVLKDFIQEDGYFSLNSYGFVGKPNKRTGLPRWLNAEKYINELATCYADLDVGRPEDVYERDGAGLTWQDAQIEAMKRQRDGIIPPFSMMACSGRGVYLFWLLCEEKDRERLPHAHDSTIVRYKAVNCELHDRLYGLGVDTGAFDAARPLRVPGSIHTKVMKRVTYSLTVQADENGGRLTYTLPELEQWLEMDAAQPSLPDSVRDKARPPIYTRNTSRPTKERGSSPARRVGYYKANALRSADLETIEAWRGGWLKAGEKYPDGFVSPGRGLMLRLYAGWLRGSRADITQDDVLHAVAKMAANCKPPYPSEGNDIKPSKIAADAFSTDRGKHIKNVRTEPWTDANGKTRPGLCDGDGRRGWLGISAGTDPELLSRLHTIKPASVKASIPKQSDFTDNRREAIKRVVAMRGGKIPSHKDMPDILSSLDVNNPVTGKPWSRESIRHDYDALGYPKAQRGRPRRGRSRRKPPTK